MNHGTRAAAVTTGNVPPTIVTSDSDSDAGRVKLDNVHLRAAKPDDALCLSVLATQVFVDTYAPHGIRVAIAREARRAYSEEAFVQTLSQADSRVIVAERDGHLIGFAQVDLHTGHVLAPAGVQAELLRLYVQLPFKGRGVGSQLLLASEALARTGGAQVYWLTSWAHNHRARRFYEHHGYRDFGETAFTFEGESHENRVYAKLL